MREFDTFRLTFYKTARANESPVRTKGSNWMWRSGGIRWDTSIALPPGNSRFPLPIPQAGDTPPEVLAFSRRQPTCPLHRNKGWALQISPEVPRYDIDLRRLKAVQYFPTNHGRPLGLGTQLISGVSIQVIVRAKLGQRETIGR